MHAPRLSILFVTNNYTPYSSGLVSSIDGFCAALNQLGHTVTIATLDFAGHPADRAHIIRVPCSVKFRYRNNPMAVPLGGQQAIEGIIAQVRPNIVHAHHPFLLGVDAWNACQKYKLPLVFTHHSQYECFAHYLPAPQAVTKPIINYLVTAFCNKADTVIAPSASIQTLLKARHVKTPIEVVASPLRAPFLSLLDHPRPAKKDARAQLLYVGRFVPEKNIPFLFEACAQLPHNSYRLTLAGYGYLEPDLRAQAQNLGVNAHFVIRPNIEHLANLYQHTDAFLFASTSDTQAIVLAEAMATGTPVIACHGAGQDDIVSHGYNGFFATTPEHMARTIIELTHNQQLAQQIQTGARTTAAAYAPALLAQKLVQVYQAAIKTHACYTV